MLQNIIKKYSHKEQKNLLFIVLLIGILLVVVAIPTKDSSMRESTKEATEVESRVEAVLEKMQGVGKVHVMITFQDGGQRQVEGIVIIAEGGDNPVVVRNISEVIQALFDVESHKIKVIKGICSFDRRRIHEEIV